MTRLIPLQHMLDLNSISTGGKSEVDGESEVGGKSEVGGTCGKNSTGTTGSTDLYTITFNQIKFLIPDTLDMSTLALFSRNHQTELKWDLTGLRGLQFYNHTNYILVTEQMQMLLIPYILRVIPNCDILITKLAYEVGRIHLREFHKWVSQWNITRTNETDFSPEKQTEIHQQFYSQLHIDLSQLTSIYTTKEIDNVLSKCILVNYYEQHNTEKGIIVTPIPSGESVGSAMWQLYSPQYIKKILIATALSSQTWRVCRTYELSRLIEMIKYDNVGYECIILGRKVFENGQFGKGRETSDQQKCVQIMKEITSCLECHVSVYLRLPSESRVLDILQYLYANLALKYRCIFLQNNSFNQMSAYANSYVEFLSTLYKNRIYDDPPTYPISAYQLMKDKSLIETGVWSDIVTRTKLPLKEIILRNMPYICCCSEWAYQVKAKEQIEWLTTFGKIKEVTLDFGNTFGYTQLASLINTLEPKRIIVFTDCLDQDRLKLKEDCQSKVNRAMLNVNYELLRQSGPEKKYVCGGLTSSRIHKFVLKNNQLNLTPIKQISQISVDWVAQLDIYLQSMQVEVLHKSEKGLSTAKTEITLQDFTLSVESESREEVLLVAKWVQTGVQQVNLM